MELNEIDGMERHRYFPPSRPHHHLASAPPD